MIDKIQYKLLLDGTVKKPDGSDTTKELLNYIRDSKPKTLFRYRACNDFTLQALIDNKLYFGSSCKFNDPYDCLLYFDVDRLKNEVRNNSEIKKIEEAIIAAKETGTFPPQLSQDAIAIIRSLADNAILARITNSLTNPNQFNNLKSFYLQEIDENVRGLSNYFSKYAPMACFSEKPNNLLMWSHYADSHRGFVLEYDTDAFYTKCTGCKNITTSPTCDWKTTLLFPIVYTKQRYDATQFLSDQINIDILNKLNYPNIWGKLDELDIIKVGIYKHTQWAYEHEWRLFLYLKNNFDESNYWIDAKPVSIYMGCRISSCYEKLLIAYAKENKIKLYKMSESPSKLTYKLHKINLLK